MPTIRKIGNNQIRKVSTTADLTTPSVAYLDQKKAEVDLTNVSDTTVLNKLESILGTTTLNNLKNVPDDTLLNKLKSLPDATTLNNLGNVLDATILNKLKNVDGRGSGLDADLVRGLPADFTSSRRINGYQKLPSRIIIQWGFSKSSIVTFPITFPKLCFGVVVTKGTKTSGYLTAQQGVWNISKTGFRFALYYAKHSKDITKDGAYWLAIGY